MHSKWIVTSYFLALVIMHMLREYCHLQNNVVPNLIAVLNVRSIPRPPPPSPYNA